MGKEVIFEKILAVLIEIKDILNSIDEGIWYEEEEEEEEGEEEIKAETA